MEERRGDPLLLRIGFLWGIVHRIGLLVRSHLLWQGLGLALGCRYLSSMLFQMSLGGLRLARKGGQLRSRSLGIIGSMQRWRKGVKPLGMLVQPNVIRKLHIHQSCPGCLDRAQGGGSSRSLASWCLKGVGRAVTGNGRLGRYPWRSFKTRHSSGRFRCTGGGSDNVNPVG